MDYFDRFPQPPAFPPDYRYQWEPGKWYVFRYCSDADQALMDGLAPCCGVEVFGPFETDTEADEAGSDITNYGPPFYYRIEQK
jgi:hypothetical protein